METSIMPSQKECNGNPKKVSYAVAQNNEISFLIYDKFKKWTCRNIVNLMIYVPKEKSLRIFNTCKNVLIEVLVNVNYIIT